jgi:N-acetylglucosamine-6-phosphate deacetylase
MTGGESETVLDCAALLTPLERFDSGRIVVRDGIILAAGASSEIPIPEGARVIDLRDGAVVPGFIDPHIHGAHGADIMDASYEALNTVSRFIASSGVTTFLPTTVSSTFERTTAVVEAIGALIATRPFDGAQPVGIHLEGPFINPLKRGAHPAAHIVLPDSENAAMLRQWVQSSGRNIRLVTFAPELDGAEEIIREGIASGFTLAMGHSNAS